MIQLYNQDCLEAMKKMEDNAFDLAIVDPPYSDKFSLSACADNKAKKGNYKIDSLNGNLPTEEYFSELKRVSKNQIIWGSNWFENYFGVGGICWFKNNTGNYSPCEFAYQSFNNHIYHIKYTWNGMIQENMKDKEKRIHPNQKPIALYTWLLSKYAKQGDKILDTHLGSGSIAIACHDLGFDLTGYELDKDYFAAAKNRLEKHQKQLKLF